MNELINYVYGQLISIAGTERQTFKLPKAIKLLIWIDEEGQLNIKENGFIYEEYEKL